MMLTAKASYSSIVAGITTTSTQDVMHVCGSVGSLFCEWGVALSRIILFYHECSMQFFSIL